MLGWLRGTTEAGVYSVAGALSEVVSFGLGAASAKISPLVASGRRPEDQELLQARLSEAVSFVMLVALIVAVGLLVAGYPLLGLFGTAFLEAYAPLCVLVIARLFHAAFGLAICILPMSGHPRSPAVVLTGAVVLNAVLNMLLIPSWGMMGAALASALAIFFWNYACHVLALRHTGLDGSAMSFGAKRGPTQNPELEDRKPDGLC
jgi:O-antigen/teichoic acid export membrane protein